MKTLKKIKQTIIGIAITIIAFSGCQQPAKEITDKTGKLIETEMVVDNQTGLLDSSINYCFYLPKNYNGIDKLPVVIFLDPHANGKISINKYAKLANQYGYVFVSSNNIKNGQSANFTSGLFQNLLKETKNRFVIDENRMFTAGFSGGAKLAMMFAQQLPEIIGVAACGGSLPISSNSQPNYYYAGIVGNEDFNYLEVHQTFTVFDQWGFDYTSSIFNGAHEWPPAKNFEMALIGFNIYTIKIKRSTKDEEWLDMVWLRMNDSVKALKTNKDLIQENIYLSQIKRWFYGLKNIKDISKKAYEIDIDPEFRKLAIKRQKLIQNEVKLRAEFIKAIQMRDLDWWNREIENINTSTHVNDYGVAQVSKRLLNYLSMASYMLVKTDLDDSRIDAAAKKLKIYEMVDADNPDVYLMYARYYLLLDDIEAMKLNFKKAQDLGFNDIETYKNETSWTELMNHPALVE